MADLATEGLKEALDADDKITAVFSQANESSTGVRHPVEEIAKIKMVDLNCTTVESAVAQIAGSARSMGLEVVG